MAAFAVWILRAPLVVWGVRYSNPWPHEEHRVRDVLRWKLGRGPKEERSDAPDVAAEVVKWRREEAPQSGWRVTWLGHAAFLLQGGGRNFLVDPMFSSHCAPLPVPGLRREVAPPCALEELPDIHAVLLTHSHYDHLDLPTLRALGRGTPLMVAGGHGKWLARRGFTEVTEVPWFGATELAPGLTATATPAQHFSSRTPFDCNRGHWCGWLIEGAGAKIWHAGDSGYCPAFREIGERLGPVDFAMIPIGAYAPRWIMKPMHMTPEEAVQAFKDARCHRAVAMHWGTFRLTDEPLGEPPLRLAAELARLGIDPDTFVSGKVGQAWSVSGGAMA
jgi:N-acyl-phosphatidylethanolamine-hydrolysing phospholipase D